MTSYDRHNIRYQNRRRKRALKKEENAIKNAIIQKLMNYERMYEAGKRSIKNVDWKASTQEFEVFMVSKVADIIKRIRTNRWKPTNYKEFTVVERGKAREIKASHITDRPVHKVIANDILLPIYQPQMIYNNGASMKNKGYDFSLQQVKRDLQRFYKTYGLQGWVLSFDLSKFFPMADHNAIHKRHNDMSMSLMVTDILENIEEIKPDGKGLPLGLEVSQIEMTTLPSGLDNYIKCQLHLKYIGHYMDDYYVLIPPDKDPKEILGKITKKAEQYGFTINKKKIHVYSMGKPFKYCKTTYKMTDTGKVIMVRSSAGVSRTKKKMNIFKKKWEDTEHKKRKKKGRKYKSLTMEDIRASIQSALAPYKKYNNHNRYLRIKRIFYSIFGFDAKNTQEFRKRDFIKFMQTQ